MFTKQEQNVWIFIFTAAVIGLIVGGIRNGFFYNPTVDNMTENQFSIIADNIENESEKHQENTTNESNEIVNINTANKAELMTLPKIGPVTAERIIHYREEYGNFKSIEDLVHVKGIGPKTFEELVKRVTILEGKK